ncbi:MAG: UDP-3-O-(3-hydroxymyristoyl)glucosamine N-acyltransferase [Gammaproteobacteria bacterium]|nr:UDP-3-O-(3-hydroxymyristoyl)glucosamine N-acyltransferase [Gammaproteobacteria bacterium]MBU1656093.1 UDP-3-O-(3-hydroxymyristoyl)glucosamine N-acyltransferase [Gammaproteobacteria bacterium]MBU1962178.1 UDP-3-O-(3-hydroxymyristoyl)glucosamine N-acyltransferase [Gammaproteobacteria bacterium]
MQLSKLAEALGAEFTGDGDLILDQVAPLQDAGPGALSFLANKAYRKHLAGTGASAVVLKPEWVSDCPCGALLSDNPYLLYARAASLLFPEERSAVGVHPSAVVADTALLGNAVSIGPMAVIEEGVELGARVYIGPGCVIGRRCRVGADSRLLANVTLGHGVVMGERVLIKPGAVIGADGFGFANDDGRWVKVPQLGGVRIGNDVEIGANTCIDRGSARDTVIGDGVKLDNQIQIGHNAEIGEHTAAAAHVGISGSTRIGRYCTLAGASAYAGHIVLADHVHCTAMTGVTHSLSEPGVYSGGVPAEPNKKWLRNSVHFRHLDELVRRIKALEAKLDKKS